MMMNQRTRKLQMMKTSSRLSMTRYLSHVMHHHRCVAKIKFLMKKIKFNEIFEIFDVQFFFKFSPKFSASAFNRPIYL